LYLPHEAGVPAFGIGGGSEEMTALSIKGLPQANLRGATAWSRYGVTKQRLVGTSWAPGVVGNLSRIAYCRSSPLPTMVSYLFSMMMVVCRVAGCVQFCA
jgi:hypothetical protein